MRPGETVTRRVVGECYGEGVLPYAKRHSGGGGAKNRRGRKKSSGDRGGISLAPYVRPGPGKR